MFRKIGRLLRRRYVVQYDPSDVRWYNEWYREEVTPLCSLASCRTFGADEHGVFRSKRKAAAYLRFLHDRYGGEWPILPQHITRI